MLTSPYTTITQLSSLYTNTNVFQYERTIEGRTRRFVRVLARKVSLISGVQANESILCFGRWKWGSSNVTGKVDEIVHEGQAQVQSNKVRYCLLLSTILNCVVIAARFGLVWLGQHHHAQRSRGRSGSDNRS